MNPATPRARASYNQLDLMKHQSRVFVSQVACLLSLAGITADLPAQATRGSAASAKPAAVKPFDPATSLPLLGIRVQGAKRIPQDKVAALAGLKIGVSVNRDGFAEAHQRLIASGLYESASYRFEKPANQNGYIVTFEVVETDLYYPIRLEDIPAPLEDVIAYLRSHDPGFDGHAAATEPALKRYSELIAAYLKERGTEMKVRGLVWAEQGGDLSVMFRPDTPIPSISDIRFEGSEVIEPLELRRIVIQTVTGILYTEDRLRTVLNNEILPAYWAHGHLAAKFTKVEALPLEEEKGVRVNVTVDEGEEYTLRSVRVLTSEYLEEDLLKLGNFPVGEPALWVKVADGMKKIQERCRREGFVKATVTQEPKLDEKNPQVDLTVVLDEGPRYLFRELKIEGLDLVTEAEVRKLWALSPGKPFNGLYPDFFVEQIQERQLMDSLGSVQAKTDLNDQAQEATVTLTFKPVDRSNPRRVPLVRPN